MSLGWLTESTLLPKRPREIEDVGKATLVNMRAALYQSETAARQPESAQAALQAQARRSRQRRADPLAAGTNGGGGGGAQGGAVRGPLGRRAGGREGGGPRVVGG